MNKYKSDKTTKQCILVDFDGTIVGSEELFWMLLSVMLEYEHGIDFTKEHELRYKGSSNEQIRLMLIEEFKIDNLSDTFYDEIKKEYMDTIRRDGIDVNVFL